MYRVVISFQIFPKKEKLFFSSQDRKLANATQKQIDDAQPFAAA